MSLANRHVVSCQWSQETTIRLHFLLIRRRTVDWATECALRRLPREANICLALGGGLVEEDGRVGIPESSTFSIPAAINLNSEFAINMQRRSFIGARHRWLRRRRRVCPRGVKISHISDPNANLITYVNASNLAKSMRQAWKMGRLNFTANSQVSNRSAEPVEILT